MCGKSQTKTQTTAPSDPAVTQAYDSLLAKSQNLASQPLQLYNGPLVAGLTPDQTSAIDQIKSSGSLAQPYLTEAGNFARQGATPLSSTPFSADAVNQYLSPYLGDVLKSTMASENQQNAQQQQQLQGNITAAGAWGGDRSAVVQAELAGQQKLADNQTNAGIENQGFNTALGQFNTSNQQSLQTQQANNSNASQAAYSLGNIGTSLQNSALTGAGAQLSAGTLEQQLNQENLNVPYEQYLQQQAFPYQNLDFLSSMFPGIAAGTGSTTKQTTPGANPFSQVLGLAATAAPFFIKDGGRARRASGGGGLVPADYSSVRPPDVSKGYIPSMSAAAPGGGGSGHGDGMVNFGPEAKSDVGSNLGTLGGNLYDAFKNNGGLFGNAAGYGGMFGASAPTVHGYSADAMGAGSLSGLDLSGLFSLAHGGRARLADGGDDDSDPNDEGRYVGPSGASALSLADTPPQWRGKVTNYADAPKGSLSDGNPTWDDGTPVVTGADDAGSATTGDTKTGWGLQHAPKIVDSPYKPKPDWRRAMVTAGAAMMAGTSPQFGVNVGRGVQEGVQEYYGQEDKDNHPEVDHSGPTTFVRYADGTVVDTGIPTEAAINAKATNDYRISNAQQISADRQARIAEEREAAADRVAQAQQAAADRAAYERGLLAMSADRNSQGKFGSMVPGKGVDAKGNPVDGIYTLNEKTGQPVFTPGGTLQARTVPKATGLNPDQAMGFAQRDYDRLYPAPKPDPSNPGAAIPPRPTPPEGMQAWLKKRATAYQSGAAAPPSGGLPTAPAPAAGAAPAAAAPAAIPARPPSVPPGAQYSPSRHMWRDPAGKIYNATGQPVQ